jgi:hypothetical protein
MGVNQFSALTDEEFASMNLGFSAPKDSKKTVEINQLD